jgi:hypothetical protein
MQYGFLVFYQVKIVKEASDEGKERASAVCYGVNVSPEVVNCEKLTSHDGHIETHDEVLVPSEQLQPPTIRDDSLSWNQTRQAQFQSHNIHQAKAL